MESNHNPNSANNPNSIIQDLIDLDINDINANQVGNIIEIEPIEREALPLDSLIIQPVDPSYQMPLIDYRSLEQTEEIYQYGIEQDQIEQPYNDPLDSLIIQPVDPSYQMPLIDYRSLEQTEEIYQYGIEQDQIEQPYNDPLDSLIIQPVDPSYQMPLIDYRSLEQTEEIYQYGIEQDQIEQPYNDPFLNHQTNLIFNTYPSTDVQFDLLDILRPNPEIRNEDIVLYQDDAEIQIRTVFEENKATEEEITASLNFLFNYFEVKDIEQEIPCTLSLKGSSIKSDDLKKYRPGLDIICVVDVSGSMGGVKLELVKKTMEFMLTVLNKGDRVSIVVFSDNGQRIIKLTEVEEAGKIELEAIIKSINIIGGTNIISGLEKGLAVIKDRRIVNQVTSILLLTDGQDDSSYTVIQRARNCTEKYKTLIRGSYSVHTFGYGSDHDAKVMQEIARSNNGNFYYVENAKDIPSAFANCLGELVSLVADKIEVSLITQPCSVPFHLSKVYSETGDTHFSMPQVYASDKKDSVFMLKFPPHIRESQEIEIIRPIKAIITYENKNGEKKTKEIELEILISQARDEIEVNEDVMVNFYRCRGAEILKIIANLAELRKHGEAKEQAVIGANELKWSLVKDHPVIKALISDLEDAANRVSSAESWEHGGRAQVNSVQVCHFAQKAASNAMGYMNEMQNDLYGEAMDFFDST